MCGYRHVACFLNEVFLSVWASLIAFEKACFPYKDIASLREQSRVYFFTNLLSHFSENICVHLMPTHSSLHTVPLSPMHLMVYAFYFLHPTSVLPHLTVGLLLLFHVVVSFNKNFPLLCLTNFYAFLKTNMCFQRQLLLCLLNYFTY